MATQKFTPPQLAPDLLARQLRLQQQAQDSQRLIEQGSQMPQGQMVSGHYVAPSWTQQLAAALSGPVGRAMQDRLPEQMAGVQRDQQNAMLSGFGFKPSPQQLADGLNGKTAQSFPVDMNAAPQGGAPIPAQGGGQGPMLLAGMNEDQSRMALLNLGPEKYMELLATQRNPTNEQRNLAHLPPEQRNRLIEAPFLNEAGKDGTRMIMGADGNMYAIPVQGYAETQAAITGATERARAGAQAQYDLVAVPDGQGGTRMMPRNEAIGVLGGYGSQSAASGIPVGGFGSTLPESQIEARRDLPGVIEQADAMLRSVDGLLNHAGMPNAVGARWPGASSVPGTEAANFVARLEQLQGQAFLQAFEALKGGGQITEIEGKKATDAIARLGQNQSEVAFRESLAELQEVLQAAKRRAYSRAGVNAPGSTSGTPATESSGPSGGDFSSLWGG